MQLKPRAARLKVLASGAGTESLQVVEADGGILNTPLAPRTSPSDIGTMPSTWGSVSLGTAMGVATPHIQPIHELPSTNATHAQAVSEMAARVGTSNAAGQLSQTLKGAETQELMERPTEQSKGEMPRALPDLKVRLLGCNVGRTKCVTMRAVQQFERRQYSRRLDACRPVQFRRQRRFFVLPSTDFARFVRSPLASPRFPLGYMRTSYPLLLQPNSLLARLAFQETSL